MKGKGVAEEGRQAVSQLCAPKPPFSGLGFQRGEVPVRKRHGEAGSMAASSPLPVHGLSPLATVPVCVCTSQ